MQTVEAEDVRINYDYVVSAHVVQDVRRLLQATSAAGGSSAVWQARIHKRPSILDLAGLGREIWQGVDAKDYVNQLRGEWDAR